jgi:hypothetical protein
MQFVVAQAVDVLPVTDAVHEPRLTPHQVRLLEPAIRLGLETVLQDDNAPPTT